MDCTRSALHAPHGAPQPPHSAPRGTSRGAEEEAGRERTRNRRATGSRQTLLPPSLAGSTAACRGPAARGARQGAAGCGFSAWRVASARKQRASRARVVAGRRLSAALAPRARAASALARRWPLLAAAMAWMDCIRTQQGAALTMAATAAAACALAAALASTRSASAERELRAAKARCREACEVRHWGARRACMSSRAERAPWPPRGRGASGGQREKGRACAWALAFLAAGCTAR